MVPFGSVLPAGSLSRLRCLLPSLAVVVNAYGMSETGNAIALAATPENLGYVAKGTELKVKLVLLVKI